VYERTLGDRVLKFGHEGILYQRSFVLYDHQTDSLWLQVTGEAVQGTLTGQRLQVIPSTLTYWNRWKERYPQTQVLMGQHAAGDMGTYTGLTEEHRDHHGLVVYLQGSARLYPFSLLDKKGVFQEEWRGEAVAVVYSRPGGLAVAWKRRVGDRVLTFDDHSVGPPVQFTLRDQQTGSLWDALSGVAESGPLAGESLQRMLGHPILLDRFAVFHPEGTVAESESESESEPSKQ
jgi:hypothetical protein